MVKTWGRLRPRQHSRVHQSAPAVRGEAHMPMIDVYSARGTFDDKHALARDLAAAVMRWEKVPDLALFRKNTAAFVHDLPADSLVQRRR